MKEPKPEATPAQLKQRYVNRLLWLAGIIAISLAAIYILIPGEPPTSGYEVSRRNSAGGTPAGENPAQSSGQAAEAASGAEAQESLSGSTAGSAGNSGAAEVDGSGGVGTEPGIAAGSQNSSGSVVEEDRPKLIIVIDDVGYNRSGIDYFLTIPIPITFAVLPQLDYSEYSARAVKAAGQELIMHLPMENLAGIDPGPGTLIESMSGFELRRQLEANIATVPGIIGMNNHEGSKGTSDPRIMEEVLEFARTRDLLFLDSRTTAQTVAPRIASELGVAFIERDIFLDNSKERADIMDALNAGKAMARENGYAVMIGHVWTEELAQVLLDNYEFILDEGYDFATLSSIIMKGE